MVALRSTKKIEPRVFSRTEEESGDVEFVVKGGSWHTVVLKADGTHECFGEDNKECPGHHYRGHCSHVDKARETEDAIQTKRRAEQEKQDAAWEREHAQWLREMGLDHPMTADEARAAYYEEFNPDGMCQ